MASPSRRTMRSPSWVIISRKRWKSSSRSATTRSPDVVRRMRLRYPGGTGSSGPTGAAGVPAPAEAFVEGVVVHHPSRAVPRHLVDELDRSGLLVGRDVRPAVLDDLLRRRRLALLENDDRLDALGPRLVGYADDRRLLHGRVLG